MKTSVKLVLAVEAVVCLAPAAVILALGMVMVPVQVRFLFTRSEAVGTSGAFLMIAMVAGGLVGLIALANLLLWIIRPPLKFLNRAWTLFGAAAGAAPLLPYLVGGADSGWWRLVGWLPLLCTAHLMYLARDFLFPGSSARPDTRS